MTISYTHGPGRFAAGYGQLVRGKVYVLLLDGGIEAFSRRNSQIDVVYTGFTTTALQRADLTDVKPNAVTPELIAALDPYIVDSMRRAQVPGAAVAIVQDGRIVHANGIGVREQGGQDRVTPDTLMMIGSTGKTMTTMMMAVLVDEGRMAWDDQLVDILPTFALAEPEATARVTVRDLVCACTGVPRRDFELIFNASSLSAEGIVASVRDFRFFTGLGESFQYSNQMVAAGGYVATLAAGGGAATCTRIISTDAAAGVRPDRHGEHHVLDGPRAGHRGPRHSA